jgi:pyrroline-5-carboxylate reductase
MKATMNIAFIGGGNMATALIGGLARANANHQIEVLEIDAERGRVLQDKYAVGVHGSAGAWLGASEVVVLAVKPQQMREAVDAIRPHLVRPLVLSIAAGVRASTLARWLSSDVVVRTMPNTPALIGAGISGAVALPGVSPEQRSAAELILRAVGDVVWLADESLLDPVTAVSGSGPAYVFFFIEAMEQAAREMGLTETQARRLSVQTFLGAAQLAGASDEPASVLRERVTSRGGTTAAALECFEADRVKSAIVRALHAANERARQLGEEFDR